MNIKFLPEETIRRISAGEFLNSPSCVLKELIENSLDAKPTLIRIEILNSGLDLIKVIDNGIGINKNDLLLSIKRYSTSKIYFFSDLLNLNSFGFRGMALSCISYISNFSISSKSINSNDNYGWLLFNSFIKDKISFLIEPVKHNFGTIVNVKNIFFNYPLKRRELFFLIRNQFFLIKKIISYFVLSNYKINFLFYKENKLYKKYINKSHKDKVNILERINNIYGKNFYRKSIYLNIKDKYISFCGYVFLNIKFKNIKIIFLNNRIISTENLLYSIVNNFFLNFFHKDTFFSYILFFYTESKNFNINICPSKTKILFLNSCLIFSKIYNNLSLFFKKKKKNKFIKNNSYLIKKLSSNNFIFNNYLHYFLIYFGNIINIFNHRFVFSVKKNGLLIVSDLLYVFYYMYMLILKEKFFFLIKKVKIKKIKLFFNKKYFINFNNIINILNILGIDIYYKKNYFLITSLPIEFLNINFKNFFLSFIIFLNKIGKKKNSSKIIIYWLSNYIITYSELNNYNVMKLIYKFHSCYLKFQFKFKKKIFYFLNFNKLYLYYFNNLCL